MPIKAWFYYKRGTRRLKQQLWNEAQADLEEALRLSPTYVKAHYRLALLYFETCRYDRALDSCHKAMTYFSKPLPKAFELKRKIDEKKSNQSKEQEAAIQEFEQCKFAQGAARVDELIKRIKSTNNQSNTFRFSTINQSSLNLQRAHPGVITAIEVLPNQRVATASSNKTITIWHMKGLYEVSTLFGHQDEILSISSLPNNRLVSLSKDNSVKLWDLSSGDCISTIKLPYMFVTSFGVLSGGQIVTFGCSFIKKRESNGLHIWDVNTGDCLASSWAFSSDDSLWVVNGQIFTAFSSIFTAFSSRVSIWTFSEHNKLTRSSTFDIGTRVTEIFQLQEGRVAVVGWDKTVILNPQTAETLVTFERRGHVYSMAEFANVWVFIRGSDALQVWERSSGKLIFTLKIAYGGPMAMLNSRCEFVCAMGRDLSLWGAAPVAFNKTDENRLIHAIHQFPNTILDIEWPPEEGYQKIRKKVEPILRQHRQAQHDRNRLGGLLKIGRFGFLRGHYSDAKMHLEKALALDANNQEAWFLLGQTHQALGNKTEALNAYEHVLESDSNYKQSIEFSLALALELESWEKVNAFVVRLLKIDPKHQEALKMKPVVEGYMLVLGGWYDLAIGEFDRLIARNDSLRPYAEKGRKKAIEGKVLKNIAHEEAHENALLNDNLKQLKKQVDDDSTHLGRLIRSIEPLESKAIQLKNEEYFRLTTRVFIKLANKEIDAQQKSIFFRSALRSVNIALSINPTSQALAKKKAEIEEKIKKLPKHVNPQTTSPNEEQTLSADDRARIEAKKEELRKKRSPTPKPSTSRRASFVVDFSQMNILDTGRTSIQTRGSALSLFQPEQGAWNSQSGTRGRAPNP
ncbi:tetratricopeptide repeat protein [Legionella impletisoli]|uniref:Tetratricopeptide repeat protein n=1 Tax=Legionella impletisoli TaxID=343510 RepID=A0A917JX83_9GAMM|nr:tetratricopeptide repeat protein [Legionella impletisoli]GGI88314.1 hypothetical protein GCM10007966_16350 [Legionella impletisoli]